MDLQLRAKKALVTGSSAGIGFAIASALAQEGASVVINGRTEKRVTAAVRRIQDRCADGHVSGVVADLSKEAGVQELLQRIPEADILVNNLGIYEAKAFAEISDDDWLRVFNVNVMSGVRLSRHYLPVMTKKGWGRIIFISSESAVNIPAEMIHYGMTKTAQLAIARGLAEATAGTNVTVNSILAGPTSSEGVEQFMEGVGAQKGLTTVEVERQFFETVRPSSLLQRFITPEEVANIVVLVTSPLSSAVNGAALRVDGGVVRSII